MMSRTQVLRQENGIRSEPASSVLQEASYQSIPTTSNTANLNYRYNPPLRANSNIVTSLFPPPPPTSQRINLMTKVSTLPSAISEESLTLSRTISAQSLPASTTSSGLQLPYERILYQLAHDPNCHKDVSLGRRIGFYKLGKELGQGNFSKVKLGVHVLSNEKVAVKIMEKGKMDPKAQRLLESEINSMEKMHHPNIIRLFECVETLSRTYLVMEYAGGGELYDYVSGKGKMTETEAKPIFAQLVSAVSHMHQKGIVHRDIKAENVIFAQPGWVKLADFGFSCHCNRHESLSTFCGSPPYAAPELFQEKHYSGQKVDIWALGVLLYYLLVGTTPFKADTIFDLKNAILKGDYRIPDYVSTFASHMINRMLDMNPTTRINVDEMKKTYWLSGNRFPRSYIQCSLAPKHEELESSEIARKVWCQLNDYGITSEMMVEAALHGARNAIIGTYRIVLYQAQAVEHDKERIKVHDHVTRQAKQRLATKQQLKTRSKTCTVL